MRTTLPALACLAMFIALAPAPRRASAAVPSIYNLGTLGGTSGGGNAVNVSGRVTGWSRTAGDAESHPFLYSGTPGDGGVMHDLGTLGVTTGIGHAVNASGQVAGESLIVGDNLSHAFLYTGTPSVDGAMHDLGTLGGLTSAAYGINDGGQVVGASYPTPASASAHAFLYNCTPVSGGGVMQDLGTLGGTFSSANAMNGSGQIVGQSSTTGEAAAHAFLFTGLPGSGGVMRDLGTLGGKYSGANAINDGGQIAGHSEIAGRGAVHAIRYTGIPGGGGVMQDLGTLGGNYATGYAIDLAGHVAGRSRINSDANLYHAFLYTGTPGVDSVMHDLDLWLDGNDPVEGAKWTLASAAGLNDIGWVTGVGFYDDGPGGLGDGQRAFVLDARSLVVVPEPSGVALIGLAAAACLRRRRKRAVARAIRCEPLEARRLLSFSPGTVATSGTLPVAADFNNDGRRDVATVTDDATDIRITVVLGNGDGTFQQPPVRTALGLGPADSSGAYPQSLSVGDFNQDGKLDLAVAILHYDTLDNEIRILLGNGGGTFAAGAPVAVAYGYWSIRAAAGDLNGDGKPDVVSTSNNDPWSFDSEMLEVRLGRGDGTFAYGGPYYSDDLDLDLYLPELADFNGDGRRDVAVPAINRTGSFVRVYLANANGALQVPPRDVMYPYACPTPSPW